jgi:hypothetical protein
MEQAMLNFRPIPCAREDSAAGDEALLEQAVEAALMETAGGVKDPSAAQATAKPDAAEAFLQRAAAFLNARADRAGLLERLRGLVAIESAEPPPAVQPDGADRKPE